VIRYPYSAFTIIESSTPILRIHLNERTIQRITNYMNVLFPTEKSVHFPNVIYKMQLKFFSRSKQKMYDRKIFLFDLEGNYDKN
jgi:hypothetical protein